MEIFAHWVTGSADGLVHIVLSPRPAHKDAALCSALPRYFSAESRRNAWYSAAAIELLAHLCPVCVQALAATLSLPAQETLVLDQPGGNDVGESADVPHFGT